MSSELLPKEKPILSNLSPSWQNKELDAWAAKNFPRHSKMEDLLPDPTASEGVILAESSVKGLKLQRIETQAGQFIRIFNEKGNIVLLIRDV